MDQVTRQEEVASGLRLSPSVVGSVYPALQNLQRISHGHGDSTTLVNDQFTSQTLPPTINQNQEGPSVISAPSLPSYPQFNHEAVSSSHPAGSHLDSAVPDLLHSHVPQTRPSQHRQHRNQRLGEGVGPAHHRARSSRHRRRQRVSTPTAHTQEGSCKEPCVKCVVVITTFRWVLVVLSFLGVFCVVTGIVLAAIRSAGNSFLFLAIMFIGLGVLLVIVVGVGWKCTPRGHEPLHALFGIGNFGHGHSRSRHPRRHRNRDGNWFGGYLYPEFQYRRPPPSYAASMQDYQNQGAADQDTSTGLYDGPVTGSPPPSYRSRSSTVHSAIHITFSHDSDVPNSRPPTYRSRAPSRRPSIAFRDTSDSVVPSSEDGVTEPVLLSSQNLVSSAVAFQSHKNVTQDVTNSPELSNQPGSNGVQLSHQRTASEDCHILEQTLQSLAEHFGESVGITNEGARFHEHEFPENSNTHF